MEYSAGVKNRSGRSWEPPQFRLAQRYGDAARQQEQAAPPRVFLISPRRVSAMAAKVYRREVDSSAAADLRGNACCGSATSLAWRLDVRALRHYEAEGLLALGAGRRGGPGTGRYRFEQLAALDRIWPCAIWGLARDVAIWSPAMPA